MTVGSARFKNSNVRQFAKVNGELKTFLKMDQVILFDKSLQQRRNEYLDVLGGQRVLSVSQIKQMWSFYLELSLDPSGWQAIWKIPRLTCEFLKITFPTIVLVYVEDVNCKELSAMVRILAVQDDISLSAKHTVNLINLWPMREQDSTVALNIENSANCLDMLRFFYNNVFMPWDYEEDETLDWLSNHLESRLRLFYDIKNGVIPHSTSEHIHSLIVEARRMQTMKEQIESELETISEVDVDLNDDVEDKRLQRLMELHVRMAQIRAEIEILENPLMRSVILKRQVMQEGHRQKFWLILDGAKVDEYMEFLSRVKEQYPNEEFSFAPDLKNVNSHDMVILSKSTHHLSTIGGLEQGGYMKGMYEKSETVITSDKEEVMLDFSGEVELENLTINARKSSCAILVRDGITTLRNCNLVGDGVSSTHQGIIVLNGNKLKLFDCEISGFSIAIVGNSGSTITMTNCKISKATFGVKIYEKSHVDIQNCEFSKCLEYAFFADVDDSDAKIGGFDLLQSLPNITCQGLKGQGNVKGDVMINHKHKIKPVKDVFALEYSSEEEMDFANDSLNNTVMENANVAA